MHYVRSVSIGMVQLLDENVVRGVEDEEGCDQKIEFKMSGTPTILLYMPARSGRAPRQQPTSV